MAQSLFIDSTHWRHMYLLFAMLWGPLLAWQTDMRERGLIGGGLQVNAADEEPILGSFGD